MADSHTWSGATQSGSQLEVVEPGSNETLVTDEVVLARWGKKQQLRRAFGLLSVIGLTTTLMITWEGICGGFQYGLYNGGPAGFVYAYLYSWTGAISQVLVVAELGSMIPITGGQYNWVAILAPKSQSKFLSYLTGWMTVVGWQAGTLDTAYGAGTIIQALVQHNYPSYDPKPYQGVLLAYAVTLVSLLINTVLIRLLPRIESLIFVVHICGFFAILIAIVYLGPHTDASFVFTKFANAGEWPTQGLSFFVGFTSSMITLLGIDAAAHIAEEIQRATRVIPYSMISSVAINGTLGFAMLLALLFSITDLDGILNDDSQYPVITLFANAVGSNSGGSAMTATLILADMFANVGLMTAASRMVWAFAREKGMPGYTYLARVEPRTKLPLYAIGLTACISAVILLINLGSSVALNAFNSLTVSGFFTSYLFSACVMLWRRIAEPSTLIYGPFRLGKFGIPVTIYSIIYTTIGLFFTFWPTVNHPTAETMNWAVVVYGAVWIIALVFWFTFGRKVYQGPIIEVPLEQTVYFKDS